MIRDRKNLITASIMAVVVDKGAVITVLGIFIKQILHITFRLENASMVTKNWSSSKNQIVVSFMLACDLGLITELTLLI